MLPLSARQRRSRLLVPCNPEVRSRRAETVLFSVRRRSGVRCCRIYSSVRAANSEGLIKEPGSAMQAVVPRPCPRLEISMVPPFALTKVDAIQKPSPEPGPVARRPGLRKDRGQGYYF